jgi:transposase
MSTSYYIALDTHCSFSEMVAVSTTGRIVKRQRCATTIPDLVELLESVRKPRILTFEEGPLADWLARHLRPYVDRLIVCEPRRNHLIAKEGDKDDALDAEKLAHLLRGNYLKEVHQTASLDRAILKQHVGFYHARVRERVRQGHQLVALLRRHGVFTSIARLLDPAQRKACWKQLPPRKILRTDLDYVWEVYELLLKQEEAMRADLIRLARREEPVRRFAEVPGLAWIRSVTFYAYIDTPYRFASKSALWRYCGLGLERRHSGQGATRVRVAKGAHRRLKNVLIGAAMSAASKGDNPLAEKYFNWTLEKGEHPCTARRNVARSIASLLWSLWKTSSRYDPAQVYVGGRLCTSGEHSQ